MLDKMDLSDDEANKVTNGFTSDLFNETNIDNLVNFQNVNEPQNSIMNEYPKITEEDSYKLWLLLNDWKLGYLYNTCIDSMIDLECLSNITSTQCEKLLKNFPLGIQIKFEICLSKWKTNNQVPNQLIELQSVNKHISDAIPMVLPETTTVVTKPVLSLSKILEDQSQGSLVLANYKKFGSLNDASRLILVDIIIKTAIKENIIMTIKTAEEISNQIVAAFPNEVKDYYFMRDGNKAPKGKLYAKYHNVIRNLKNGGLIETTKKHKLSKYDENSNVRQLRNFDSETDIDDYLNSLKHDNCSFSEIEIIWRATVKYRLNYIKNSKSTTDTLKYWASYKLPAGYKLIDIDFNMLYPTSSNLMSIYSDVSFKLLDLLKLKIKDSQSLKLLEDVLEKNPLENGRAACIFHLLHAVFIPTAKKSTRNDKGQKSTIKYSIRDSQQSFLINVDTVSQFEDVIAKKKGLGIPIQPFIVVIGQLLEPKDIIVYFDDIKYKVLTIQRAVDVVFKLFHTFNLLYPDESYILWLFIQKFFYNIHIKSDQSHPIISLIISELNK